MEQGGERISLRFAVHKTVLADGGESEMINSKRLEPFTPLDEGTEEAI